MDRSGSPLQILLVEDDADVAASTALLLRLAGHDVHTAGDGPAALLAAERSPPDVALVDIGLPGMDGYEVARRLQEGARDKRPLVVAVTGRAGEDARLRSAEAGIDLHLVKPVDPEQLLPLLAHFRDILHG
jgi:CheY-like chemotaxis protein